MQIISPKTWRRIGITWRKVVRALRGSGYTGSVLRLRIVIILGIIAVTGLIFIIFNWQFFVARIRYDFSPAPTVFSTPDVIRRDRAEHPTGTPNTLTIKSLGISAPVVYTDKTSEAEFQKALENGPVHYPGTAKPGELGNCYIFGHSSDFALSKGNYKTVFALLPKIQTGADIAITNSAGTIFHYTVKYTAVVAPTDVQYLSQYNYQKKYITIQTSYPVGTALKRFIAVGELQ